MAVVISVVLATLLNRKDQWNFRTPRMHLLIWRSCAITAWAPRILRESTRPASSPPRSAWKSSDAEWLRQQLLLAVLREDCQPGRMTEFGQRHTVDLMLRHDGREARIRSAWIIRADEKFPRLVSCYVL
jgi:hypothetical protein